MSSIIEALTEASEKDLKEVEEKIAEHQKNIDALKGVRRILQSRLGVKPEVKTRASPKVSITKGYREKAAKYLLHAGTARPLVLAKQCDIPDGSDTAVLEHPWFQREVDGVRLSPEGRKVVS